jgi:Holliday junction resolvase-like predicted endonuclease
VPRLDLYHNAVRRALQKDGWTITHDPFLLRWGDTTLFADLGAELIAAEKPTQKVVVEVKTFPQGTIAELQKALGQYLMYERILAKTDVDRRLYLAVGKEAYSTLFDSDIAKLLLSEQVVRLLIFDERQEVISTWLP